MDHPQQGLDGELRERVIPCSTDRAAWKANCEAINQVVGECRYPYIISWGKFLGFAPEAVMEQLEKAELDEAPFDAIQKVDDEWMLLSSIKNDTNRRRVMELALR